MTTSSPGLRRTIKARRRPPVTPGVTITSSQATPFICRAFRIFSRSSGIPPDGVYLLNPWRIDRMPSSFIVRGISKSGSPRLRSTGFFTVRARSKIFRTPEGLMLCIRSASHIGSLFSSSSLLQTTTSSPRKSSTKCLMRPSYRVAPEEATSIVARYIPTRFRSRQRSETCSSSIGASCSFPER